LLYFNNNNKHELSKHAASILGESNNELKDKQKNFFIIATSMPIIDNHDHKKKFQNISKKFHLEIIDKMKESGKQIDYAMEILNEEFLETMKSC
jgi:hypothetical protein